jgi:hypothetical protein
MTEEKTSPAEYLKFKTGLLIDATTKLIEDINELNKQIVEVGEKLESLEKKFDESKNEEK